MKQELYALQRAVGYTSDYVTFQGYLGYREQLEEIQKNDTLLPTPRSPSSSSVRARSLSVSQSEKQIVDNFTQITLKPSSSFLERALKKARDSIDGYIHSRSPGVLARAHESLLYQVLGHQNHKHLFGTSSGWMTSKRTPRSIGGYGLH